MVKLIKVKDTWRAIADAARTTINQKPGNGEPSSMWKKRMLLAEHSPVRKLQISWKWFNLPYWVSAHFVRHKIGVEHFVRTQRTDRTGIDRNELPQGALVEHEAEANAQAIINISRKRMCMKASPETRDKWIDFIDTLRHTQPELFSVCVPDCVYRGWCYEFESCGQHKKDYYKKWVEDYRKGINE